MVPALTTQLQVYTSSINSGVRFAVDKTIPSTPAGQGNTPLWAEGQAYAIGQLVSHNGKIYRAVIAHTAWVGAGWRPDVAWTNNVLWASVLPPDVTTLAQPIPWVDGRAYSVGQVVIYNGKMYRCAVAHTAWLNAGWRPDVFWIQAASYWVPM